MIALVIVVAAGCATVPPCPAKGGPAWRELTSDHFVLRSDLNERKALVVLRTLEDTRTAMLAGVWPGAPVSPERIQALALSGREEVMAYVGPRFVGIHIRRPPFPPMLLASELGGDGGIDFKHELAHDLSKQLLPLQPTWFAEGQAEFLSTIHPDPHHDGLSVLGDPLVDDYAFLRQHGPVSLMTLLGRLPENNEESTRFYATSWLLVHYLYNHRGAELEDFQRRLGALEPGPQAFRAAFPDLASGELEDVLTTYARRGQYRVARPVVPAWNEKHVVRFLSDAEVHAARASLRSLMPPNDGEAPAHFAAIRADVDEALRAAPPPIEALAVAFYTPNLDHRLSRAEVAKTAVASNPGQWMAWLMAAEVAPPGSLERDQALHRALVLKPNEPEVLIALAHHLAQAERWAEVLGISNQILGEGAVHPDLWVLHLMALIQTGRCQAAEAWGAALEGYLPAARVRDVAAIRARPCRARARVSP